MRALVPISLVVSGLGLAIVIVWLVGVAAAVAVPASYFEWFGDSKRIAFLLLDFALIVAPVFVLAACWTVLTFRRLRPHVASPLWLFLGALCVYLYYAVVVSLTAVSFVESPTPTVWLGHMMNALLPVNGWSLPTFLAPWLGMSAGFILAVRPDDLALHEVV